MHTATERIARAGSRLRHPAGTALPPHVQRAYLAGVAAELHDATVHLTETTPPTHATPPQAHRQAKEAQPPTQAPDSPTGANA